MSMYGYLAHHGVKDQTWGVRNGPPYPLDSNPREQKEKKEKAARRASLRERISGYRKTKKKKAALDKARKAKAAKKAAEEKRVADEERKRKDDEARAEKQRLEEESTRAEKQRIIDSGDINLVLKNSSRLTNEEINAAINRINTLKSLEDLKMRDVKAGWDKKDALFDKIGKLGTYTDKVLGLYNRGANIYNAFNGEGKELPTVNLNFQNGKSAGQIAADLAKKTQNTQTSTTPFGKKLAEFAKNQNSKQAQSNKQTQKNDPKNDSGRYPHGSKGDNSDNSSGLPEEVDQRYKLLIKSANSGGQMPMTFDERSNSAINERYKQLMKSASSGGQMPTTYQTKPSSALKKAENKASKLMKSVNAGGQMATISKAGAAKNAAELVKTNTDARNLEANITLTFGPNVKVSSQEVKDYAQVGKSIVERLDPNPFTRR